MKIKKIFPGPYYSMGARHLTVKLNDTDAQPVSEQIGVDIEGVNDEMFIDASDGSEKDTPDAPEEEENEADIRRGHYRSQ